MYFKILLTIHVLSAIVGIGPTFAFGFLGARAGKVGGVAALELITSIVEIEKKLVTPFATVVQPVTGTLMIFATDRHIGFFSYEWLWIAIVLYLAVIVISYAIDLPIIHRVIEMMKSEQAGTPEFISATKKTSTLGATMGILTIAIAVLMVLKPGN